MCTFIVRLRWCELMKRLHVIFSIFIFMKSALFSGFVEFSLCAWLTFNFQIFTKQMLLFAFGFHESWSHLQRIFSRWIEIARRWKAEKTCDFWKMHCYFHLVIFNANGKWIRWKCLLLESQWSETYTQSEVNEEKPLILANSFAHLLSIKRMNERNRQWLLFTKRFQWWFDCKFINKCLGPDEEQQ